MTQKAWERGRDWAEMREGCIPWCAAGLRLFSAPAWRITAFTLQLKNSPVIIYLAGVSLSALCSWRRISSAWDWYTSTNLTYKCRTLDFRNITTNIKIPTLIIVIKEKNEEKSVWKHWKSGALFPRGKGRAGFNGIKKHYLTIKTSLIWAHCSLIEVLKHSVNVRNDKTSQCITL